MPRYRRWSPEVIATVGRLALTTDRTLSDIAAELGVGQQTACRWNQNYRWRPVRADHGGTILEQWAGSNDAVEAALAKGVPGVRSRALRRKPGAGRGAAVAAPSGGAGPAHRRGRDAAEDGHRFSLKDNASGLAPDVGALGEGAAFEPASAGGGEGEDFAALEPGEMLGRLEAATFRAIAVLDSGAASGGLSDPERTARALASLTQTLKIIAGLKGPAREGGDDEEPPPRPIEDLRDELLRRCARLRAQRRSARRDSGLQPG